MVEILADDQHFAETVARYEKTGLRTTVSKVLAILTDYQWHSFHDVERQADLRQPEVSTAINKHLKKFIEIKEVQGCKKHGRPEKHVQMTSNMYQSLLSTLQKEENERHKQVLGAIDSVRVVRKR